MMIKILTFTASISLVSSFSPHSVTPARKPTNLEYVVEEAPEVAVGGGRPYYDLAHKNSMLWTDVPYVRTTECALNDNAECSIEELDFLSDVLLSYNDECSVEALSAEDCMTEVSTRYAIQRILQNKSNAKKRQIAEKRLELVTPTWYRDYRDFYHM